MQSDGFIFPSIFIITSEAVFLFILEQQISYLGFSIDLFPWFEFEKNKRTATQQIRSSALVI